MWQLFLLCCSLLAGLFASSFAEEEITFVVLNAKTGKILSQQGAHKKQYPASTTKIAFVSYVLSSGSVDLDQKLVVPADAVRAVSVAEKAKDNFNKYPAYVLESASSIAGFQAGEVITLKDALYGAMLPSGNDAVNTLAYYWGNGSIPACVDRVNAFAASLGCQNTHFMNPHGLHHPHHYSSAYDLALLATNAMQNAIFRKIVSTVSYEKPKTNKQPATTWMNTNKLILPGAFFCEQATGIKTGYYSKAQHCLVASGESSDRSIIVVLLRCSDRKQLFLLSKKLLLRFLNEPKKEQVIVPYGQIRLQRDLEGHATALSLRTETPFTLSYYPSEEPVVRAVAEWYQLRFPVKKGQLVGALKVLADDVEVGSVPLYSNECRAATWKQRFLETQGFLQAHKGAVFFIGGCVLILCFFILRRRRN